MGSRAPGSNRNRRRPSKRRFPGGRAAARIEIAQRARASQFAAWRASIGRASAAKPRNAPACRTRAGQTIAGRVEVRVETHRASAQRQMPSRATKRAGAERADDNV